MFAGFSDASDGISEFTRIHDLSNTCIEEVQSNQ